jgi:hypothetical protein
MSIERVYENAAAPKLRITNLHVYFIRFYLLNPKQRDYLKTRVQLGDARQRERARHRAGRNRSLQDSCRWRQANRLAMLPTCRIH